jgi:hypothetical protein
MTVLLWKLSLWTFAGGKMFTGGKGKDENGNDESGKRKLVVSGERAGGKRKG